MAMLHARRFHGPLGAALLVLSSVSFAATSIVFEASDLTDTTVGEDLWQYSYTVPGSFGAFSSFEIGFDALKVASLEASPVALNSDWSVATIQPLPGVPADGLYSATALVTNASVTSPFTVSFVWNGPGVPGAQPFTVLDDAFNVIETGFTAPVPEPHTYALMGAALLLLVARLRTRRAR